MAEAAINAAQVKALREATGMGMMECKKALVECEGDFDKAQDWLRVKSGAKADKVAARQASEGRIAFAEKNGVGALVEISCETDFVARDDNLIAFAAAVAQAAAGGGADGGAEGGSQDLSGLKLEGGGDAEAMRKQMVMKLGENINIRRVTTLAGGADESVCAYIHSGDKIGAMCVIKGAKGASSLGRDICMHVAAMRPQYLDADAVPADIIAREKEVFAAQAREAGKPDDMAEKIAAGKLNKHLADITLMKQPFVKDGDMTIAQVLEKAGASVRDFALFTVGGGE